VCGMLQPAALIIRAVAALRACMGGAMRPAGAVQIWHKLMVSAYSVSRTKNEAMEEAK
jgi:hypothetical protein